MPTKRSKRRSKKKSIKRRFGNDFRTSPTIYSKLVFKKYLLEHHTTLNGLINIFKSHKLKAPKKLGMQSWSPNYIFFRFVDKNQIKQDNNIGIYLVPREIFRNPEHLSFFIHPTSNIYDILSREPRDCECAYEYISPRLKTKLLIEKVPIIQKCSIKSLRETLDLLILNEDTCDGGNEIAFNQDIPIEMIRMIKIPRNELDNLPKYVLDMIIALDIRIIVV